MYQVKHVVSGQSAAEHKTKKAATAQAKEMTEAHEAIGAKHEGHPVSFEVIKITSSEEPAA